MLDIKRPLGLLLFHIESRFKSLCSEQKHVLSCVLQKWQRRFGEKKIPPRWQKRNCGNNRPGNHFQRADREPNQRALPAPWAGGLGNICLAVVWNFYRSMTYICIPLLFFMHWIIYNIFLNQCTLETGELLITSNS